MASRKKLDQKSSEVIICTRNRPADFAKLITSIISQSGNSVSNLIIIDSSIDAETESISKNLSKNASFKVDYIRVSQNMHLTTKRNIGLERAKDDTDFIHFFDDDVILDENYLESINEEFEDLTIVGVTGKDSNRTPQKNSPIKFKLGMGSRSEGVILKNGLNTLVTSATEPKYVEWLSGCAMSYRTRVVKNLRFDTRRTFDGEDTDFSYRVSFYGKLLWTPKAQYTHQTSIENFANINHSLNAYLTHMALATLEFNGKVSLISAWIGIFLLGLLIFGFGIRRRNLTGVLQGLRYMGGAVLFPGIVLFWKIQNAINESQNS